MKETEIEIVVATSVRLNQISGIRVFDRVLHAEKGSRPFFMLVLDRLCNGTIDFVEI